jgi:hypothetical protein
MKGRPWCAIWNIPCQFRVSLVKAGPSLSFVHSLQSLYLSIIIIIIVFQALIHRTAAHSVYDNRRVDVCVQTLFVRRRERRVHGIMMGIFVNSSVRYDQIDIYQYADEDLVIRGCICSTHIPSGHIIVDWQCYRLVLEICCTQSDFVKIRVANNVISESYQR